MMFIFPAIISSFYWELYGELAPVQLACTVVFKVLEENIVCIDGQSYPKM